MRTAPFPVATLLRALSDAAPSGPDLEYEPEFAALELAGAGKAERQYGEKIYPAEPPDWVVVYGKALELAGTTRDLRIALWLLRAAMRLHGLAGAVAGLQLISGLLTAFWDNVHPQLDASDGNDPTMRLSALAPLATPEAAPMDLASALLVPVRGSLTLRELALGLGKAQPGPDESTPTEAGVLQALQTLLSQHADLADNAADAAAALAEIEATLNQRLGQGHAADLAPMGRLLDILTRAIAGLRPAAAGAGAAREAGAAAPVVGGGAALASGAIGSRADAVRALEKVCEWLERNEPGNPAPLLIRRAQRLMNKTFLEIIRDLAPDSVAQIETLAGPAETA